MSLPPESTTRPLPLLGAPYRRIAGRNATKADILFHQADGVEIAVKDYAARGVLVRNTIGRFLLRREVRAYRAASGLPGIPELLSRVGPFSIAMTRVPGTPLSERHGAPLEPSFFDRLEAVLAGLHGRGVALGDLHHRDVLVAEDGAPYVVDFATAVVLGDRPGFLKRKCFAVFRDQDRVALARLRARFTGGDPEAATAAVSPSAARWHALGRRVKSIWNRLRAA